MLDASTGRRWPPPAAWDAPVCAWGSPECYADCAPGLPILAFRSRYCSGGAVLPDFADEPRAYAEAVVELASRTAPGC